MATTPGAEHNDTADATNESGVRLRQRFGASLAATSARRFAARQGGLTILLVCAVGVATAVPASASREMNRFRYAEHRDCGSGTLSAALQGGSATDTSNTPLTDLGNGSNWKPFTACVTATGSHTTLVVAIWPTVNGPTLAVDAAQAS